jgi:predicted metal-dependent HD superfamily phosphohydrolase
MLQEIFCSILSNYTNDVAIIATYWNEIEKAYEAEGRHYHTLTHLENLLQQLLPYREFCADWHAIVWAIVYHDIIYNVLRQDNEERSAEYARGKLAGLQIPEDRIQLVVDMIVATKKHDHSLVFDIDLFTDADLSILGAPWEQYQTYTDQIRKEFAIYPNLVYRPGRRKVLQHFLSKTAIYKTKAFVEHCEPQARVNIERELNMLQK